MLVWWWNLRFLQQCQIKENISIYPLQKYFLFCHQHTELISSTRIFSILQEDGLSAEATRPHKLMTLVSSISGCRGQLCNSYDRSCLLQPPLIEGNMNVNTAFDYFISLSSVLSWAVMAVTCTRKLRARLQFHLGKRNKRRWWWVEVK